MAVELTNDDLKVLNKNASKPRKGKNIESARRILKGDLLNEEQTDYRDDLPAEKLAWAQEHLVKRVTVEWVHVGDE